MTVAPTGMIAMSGRNTIMPRGYLLGGFVTKAIYYVPDIDIRPLPDPIPIIEREVGYVIAIAEGPMGDIYFTTGNAIYQLIVPLRGDCNGDGRVDIADLAALRQLLAGGPRITFAQAPPQSSWGCDVNGDGLIDERDLAALTSMLFPRKRAASSRGH
jgi:hypothetical protein